MAKIIYLLWNPYFKLLYMPWKLYNKFFECFTSKPNEHGTFWNLHIKINLKIHISETNTSVDLKFCIFLFSKSKISSSVFCPKAGPSLQAEKPGLQICRRQVFNRKFRNQGCTFTRDLIGAVASRCFPHPTLSLASEQTLKDLKRSQGHERGGEECGVG